MTIKKSLIATAVAGALAIPMAAQAGGYGRLAIGINVPNEDAAGAPGEDDIFIDDVSSYFGFQGEDDLGNGMTAFFNYQFDVGGAAGEIRHDSTRQSHIGLRGDFGSVKIGRSTQPMYEHVGVLTDWGWVATAPIYYSSAIGGGLYAPNSLNYQGGSGPVSFSATVETQDDDATSPEDSESFDKLYLGGTFDFGMGTVSLAHETNSEATGAEPSLTGIGFTYDLGEVGLRGGYYMRDHDTDTPVDSDGDPLVSGAEPSGFEVLAHTSFGGGLSGFAGVGMLDADNDDDAGNQTSFFANITRSLSSRTSLYAEALVSSVDGGDAADDTDPTTFSFGAIHTF